MLIVVENRYIRALLELALDFKAARSRDILEIHSAERAGEQSDGVHYFVNVLRAHAKRYRVNIAERLEEHAFALHDGHASLGTYIPETKHRGAVRDDGNGVPAAGQVIALADIVLYFEARRRDSGGVGKGQLVLVADPGSRLYLQLAAQFIVQFE